MKRYQPGRYYRLLWQGVRDVGKQPFTVRRHYGNTWHIFDATGKLFPAVCLRGNSKQRRQQRRLAERFLNQPTVGLCYVGHPAQLPPLGRLQRYQRDFMDNVDMEIRNGYLGKVTGMSLTIDGKERGMSGDVYVVEVGHSPVCGNFPAINGDIFRLTGKDV